MDGFASDYGGFRQGLLVYITRRSSYCSPASVPLIGYSWTPGQSVYIANVAYTERSVNKQKILQYSELNGGVDHKPRSHFFHSGPPRKNANKMAFYFYTVRISTNVTLPDSPSGSPATITIGSPMTSLLRSRNAKRAPSISARVVLTGTITRGITPQDIDN